VTAGGMGCGRYAFVDFCFRWVYIDSIVIAHRTLKIPSKSMLHTTCVSCGLNSRSQNIRSPLPRYSRLERAHHHDYGMAALRFGA
jgi:hypothetical protein